MKLSDDQILEWIRDERTVNKGFKALMDTYQERLYRQIRGIVATHEDTDDVLQNVFVKVYRGINKFEGKSGLSTWMYRIAYNESISHLKKRKAKLAVSLDDTEGGSVYHLKADVTIDSAVIEQALCDALETLPDKQKQVFEMRYYDEMTYKDISAQLSTSVGALKASYFHAVKKVEFFIKNIHSTYEGRT